MVHIRELDSTASPLDYYGFELRRKREEAGLTQRELANVVFCTGSLIGQIETARKVPQRDLSERLDVALGTDGFFSRLVGLVLRSQLPSWFQPFAEVEAQATYISTYQAQVIYGLLQTEEYARALLATGVQEGLDQLVAARMERTRILSRKQPPLTLVVLDEAALRRPVGGPDIMRQQLAHLLDLQSHRWLRIQVLAFSGGEHAGLAGSFTALRFADHPDLVYTEDVISGHMTANPDTVRETALRYASLQATALSVEDSAALITRVMEEEYGDRPGSDQRAVA
ncbi:Scr1 family TA system antitoxin-like transcriptional regulator [Streptomyces pharetrae]|uniref:helix-turn-helix domain-containing protein n=1 Tax=Streptomyces pharetrae TaxID=291370 RepID=UPI003651014F